MILILDNELEISLDDFIKSNSGDDVTPIPAEDIAAIEKLNIGDIYTLEGGAGGDTIIQRIS